MAKAEWGAKRTCMNCGARFYDLRREPIVCPACGATVDAAVQSKPRRARTTPAPVKVAAVATAAEVELETEVVEDDADLDADVEAEQEVVESQEAEDEGEEDGESAIEDVSELGDDDMTDVIETEMDEEETDR